MSFFGFGKSFTKDDLNREVAKLRDLYLQTMGPSSMSQTELKRKLALQLQEVLEVCKKGNFSGMETVEWTPSGCYMPISNITPAVQVLIELM
jgi:hypothetical protein